MQRIPLLDLARRAATLEPELSLAIERVLRSGRLLLGAETEAFEAEFAAFCGRRHAVAVASGTEALRLSLAALDIGAGDEVVVPALTAVPTAAAVCATGAIPVAVDVSALTACIDPSAVADAVTDRTRAVIPVHLYGRPAPIPDVGVPVVEDAAQAHGAVDPHAPSAAVAYSFYPTKNLGGIGDGGAVVTDDDEIAARVRRLRAHDRSDGYLHELIAGNSRMSEIEAAALRVGLAQLPAQNERRRAIVASYREASDAYTWQAPDPRHVYHLCVVRLQDRDAFRASAPFETEVHYPRTLTQQPAYTDFARHPCPAAEAWAAECVSLPCFPEMTDEEVEAVCGALVVLASR
jgi:dTDP-3-amino-3,4,6-trideoxy-alpha-D-glucose transaminase